jgi:hypothetical protein
VYFARARLEEADDSATVLVILLIDRSPDRGAVGDGMTNTDRRVEILQNFAKNTVVVTALTAVTGQLVDEPRAPTVGGPGGPWNCKYLHQPA